MGPLEKEYQVIITRMFLFYTLLVILVLVVSLGVYEYIKQRAPPTTESGYVVPTKVAQVYTTSAEMNKVKEGFYSVIDGIAEVEGFDAPSAYTTPNPDGTPAAIALNNSANIAFLKTGVDSLMGVKERVVDLENQVKLNSMSIKGLGEQIKQMNASATGGRDPMSKEPLPTYKA